MSSSNTERALRFWPFAFFTNLY